MSDKVTPRLREANATAPPPNITNHSPSVKGWQAKPDGVVPTLGLPMFQNMPIALPAQKEQQKIADCLYSIDDLITAQTQKLDVLKTHKKGLMQQLFRGVEDGKV